MKLIPNDRQIYVSARLWHEIQSKIDVAPFNYALHEGINLFDYGRSVHKFYFTFLILLPSNKLFFPGIHYDGNRKSIEVAVAIDYEMAFHANPRELVKMMEQAYLEGIDLISTLSLVETFDGVAFRKDVEAIFAVEKWYERAMEATA